MSLRDSSHAKRATIFDVAAAAGVSHQTVSRYLKGNGGLRPATLEKVERAVADLHYRPNAIARSMRTRRSQRLAIVLPDLSHGAPVAMLRGASGVAHEAGYATDVIALEGGQAQRRERVLTLLDTTRPEGILSFAPLDGLERSAALSDGTPVVVAEEFDDQMRSFGATATASAAEHVLDHLADLGHRHLLHVSGPAGWVSARNRREVFLAAAARRGLPVPVVHEGDWSVTCGYEAVRVLARDSPITGFFAANDFVALGVLRGLQDRGLHVPRDASVVGWDDESFAPWSAPGLSTVSVDRERLGRRAMGSLIAALQPDGVSAAPAVLDGGDALMHLVVRDSSGPAPATARRLAPAPAEVPGRDAQPERFPDAGRTRHR